MIDEIFCWIANFFLLYSALLVGNKRKEGFMIGMFGQGIYISISSGREQWAMVFLSSMFILMAIRNYRRWRRHEAVAVCATLGNIGDPIPGLSLPRRVSTWRYNDLGDQRVQETTPDPV